MAKRLCAVPRVLGSLLVSGREAVAAMETTHCLAAGLFAMRLGLGEPVRDALQHVFERGDGRGTTARQSRPRCGLLPHRRCGARPRASGSSRGSAAKASAWRCRGTSAPIRAELDPPVKRVHDQFIEEGGRFFVCPICFGERGLDADDLVEGAELKGATPLTALAGDGAMSFSY